VKPVPVYLKRAKNVNNQTKKTKAKAYNRIIFATSANTGCKRFRVANGNIFGDVHKKVFNDESGQE